MSAEACMFCGADGESENWALACGEHFACDTCFLDKGLNECRLCPPKPQAPFDAEVEARVREQVAAYGRPSVMGSLLAEVDRLRAELDAPITW